MASKQETDGRQMGYKCRIAGVLLLLLTSIAALIAVAVIQDTWRFKEYSLEVNTYTYVNLEGLYSNGIKQFSEHIHTEKERQRCVHKHMSQLRHTLSCECDAGRYPDVRVKAGGFSHQAAY